MRHSSLSLAVIALLSGQSLSAHETDTHQESGDEPYVVLEALEAKVSRRSPTALGITQAKTSDMVISRNKFKHRSAVHWQTKWAFMPIPLGQGHPRLWCVTKKACG